MLWVQRLQPVARKECSNRTTHKRIHKEEEEEDSEEEAGPLKRRAIE